MDDTLLYYLFHCEERLLFVLGRERESARLCVNSNQSHRYKSFTALGYRKKKRTKEF